MAYLSKLQDKKHTKHSHIIVSILVFGKLIAVLKKNKDETPIAIFGFTPLNFWSG